MEGPLYKRNICGVLLENRGKVRGFCGKRHLLPPPPTRNRGRGGAALRQPIPAAQGSMAARNRGKRVKEARGADPRPQLGREGGVPGRSGRDGGRRRAAVASGRRPEGVAVSKARGKSITGLRELDSPAHLGWWRPVDGSSRRRAALGGYGGGGGAGAWEEAVRRWLWSSGGSL